MKDRDIKIDLGAVQKTLVLPLWRRAKEAEKNNPIVCDTYLQLTNISRSKFRR
jgi:O-methyltransferase involved in polyketide biosynthesis